MDKQLFASIILGIIGITIGIGVAITTYKYSLTLEPIDSSILVGLMAMMITLGFSMALFNRYIRSV